MAPHRVKTGSVVLLLMAALLLAGCGIKSMPLPSSNVAPTQATELEVRTVERGVEISFSVPSVDQSDKQVVEAWIDYAYLPKEGDPDCPPCPPVFRNRYELNLGKHLSKLESGRFAYLDTRVPMDHQAAYRVRLVDIRGRAGQVTGMVRALRVELPAEPQGLAAEMGDNLVDLSWRPVTTLANGQPTDDRIGYIIYRKSGAERKALNERPQSQVVLVDKTVHPGQVYEYQVAAARQIGPHTVVGRPGPWASAAAQNLAPPSPPTGLVGASLADGVYLRFTPSPQQNTAGYLVMRATAKNGPWTQLGAGLNRENTFVDQNVKQGQIYFYQVVAVSDSGVKSKPSEAIEVKHQP